MGLGEPYRAGMMLEPDVVYESAGKRVIWGHTQGGGQQPCYVNVNGRKLMNGQFLNEEQAHAVATDVLMATVESDWYVRDPDISFLPWQSDGIDLRSNVMFRSKPTKFAIVLDRKGLYSLVAGNGECIAWGDRHVCVKRAYEELQMSPGRGLLRSLVGAELSMTIKDGKLVHIGRVTDVS